MIYKNGYIFREDRGFVFGGFGVENGRFTEVFDGDCAAPGEDLGGAYVIPGLVDIHIHGAVGADVSDGNLTGLTRMAAYLAEQGVTSFAPTTMTLPEAALKAAFGTVAHLCEDRPERCARPVGIHMEGPFFSEKKKGAQNGAYLRLPDFDLFRRLYMDCGGRIRIVDLAPELAGAADFTRKASALCTVSVAHTDAAYADAGAVFDAGATHLTHLFNAMPPIHHRRPGVIGAASERDVVAELICDGQHIHPSAVRMAFRLFPGRICLISDALRCCGMPDGEYELGGQTVTLSGGVARLADGTIAGAAADLFTDLRNAISFGISVTDAVNAATLNPAKAVGCDDRLGSITKGKYADFVVCDANLQREQVYLNGEALKREDNS